MSRNTEKDKEAGIHLSTREARAGNASYEHLVVAGAMVVIAALIVGVFIYAGLGADGPTRLGEPQGASEQVPDRNTAENPYIRPGDAGPDSEPDARETDDGRPAGGRT